MLPIFRQMENMSCFYTELSKEAPTPEKNGNEWRKVENMWLITNRHVAFPRITQADGTVVESIPDTFIYNMRREKDGKIEWVPIVLNKDEFLFLK